METQQTDFRLRLPTLVEYRAEAAKRRANAFCDVRDTIMGREVMPFTPRTYSMLFAAGSRFLHGGEHRESDVLQFIWLHSPGYVKPEHPEWRRRKRAALGSILNELNQPWRRWLGRPIDIHRHVAILATACAEIAQIIDDAFADAPGVAGRPGAPIATLEAYLIHEFSAAYPSWTSEQIRNTPLKQLFQLYRCAALARGNEIRDRNEEAILAAHLALRNEKLRKDTANAL